MPCEAPDFVAPFCPSLGRVHALTVQIIGKCAMRPSPLEGYLRGNI